jgi:hypothetical protein
MLLLCFGTSPGTGKLLESSGGDKWRLAGVAKMLEVASLREVTSNGDR